MGRNTVKGAPEMTEQPTEKPRYEIQPDTKAILDLEFSRQVYSEVCLVCKHFGLSLWLATGKETCAAFPVLIPEEIWNGENDHTKEYPGDRGVRFEPR